MCGKCIWKMYALGDPLTSVGGERMWYYMNIARLLDIPPSIRYYQPRPLQGRVPEPLLSALSLASFLVVPLILWKTKSADLIQQHCASNDENRWPASESMF